MNFISPINAMHRAKFISDIIVNFNFDVENLDMSFVLMTV